jgi:hypothetical protein
MHYWWPTSRSLGKWHRQNGWRQHDLTDGAMIRLEKLSEARAYLRPGSSVWCHREMHRAHC